MEHFRIKTELLIYFHMELNYENFNEFFKNNRTLLIKAKIRMENKIPLNFSKVLLKLNLQKIHFFSKW